MSAAKEADKDCPRKGVQFVRNMMPKTRNGVSRNIMRYLFETGSITSSD
jgi:hypothetical protein